MYRTRFTSFWVQFRVKMINSRVNRSFFQDIHYCHLNLLCIALVSCKISKKNPKSRFWEQSKEAFCVQNGINMIHFESLEIFSKSCTSLLFFRQLHNSMQNWEKHPYARSWEKLFTGKHTYWQTDSWTDRLTERQIDWQHQTKKTKFCQLRNAWTTREHSFCQF